MLRRKLDEDEPRPACTSSDRLLPPCHFAMIDVGLPIHGRDLASHSDSDRGLTAGYSGSSSDRPNGPSSTSMGGKSGGGSDGSNSPTT